MSPCVKVSATSAHGGGGIPPVTACRQQPNSWRSRVANEKVQNMVHWSGTHPNKVQKAGDAFLRPSPPRAAGTRNGIPAQVHAWGGSFFCHLQRTFNETTSLDSFLHLSLMPPEPQTQTRPWWLFKPRGQTNNSVHCVPDPRAFNTLPSSPAFIGVLQSSLQLCGRGVGVSRQGWNICGLATKELECPSLNSLKPSLSSLPSSPPLMFLFFVPLFFFVCVSASLPLLEQQPGLD